MNISQTFFCQFFLFCFPILRRVSLDAPKNARTKHPFNWIEEKKCKEWAE